MKITKYPQSCLVLEKGGQCIVIDPGNLVSDAHNLPKSCLLEAVLYTHQHADHFDPEVLRGLRSNDIEIYANSDVAGKVEGKVNIVTDKEEFVVAGFKVTAYELPHCKMVDGSAGPPNTGYLIDGVLFHPGDGIELTGLTSNALALPIAGPSIDFDNALAFANQIEAEKVIPMHYDGTFKADPAQFAKLAGADKVIILQNGESTEI